MTASTDRSADGTLANATGATARRRATLASLANERFDVVIIGGGIVGAGVAREAALAGWRVALVERDDFASGTSSRSSRLIHGGVRYLEHGHFSLVFESSRERRRLLALAPHLVRPLAFTWPVYRGARVPLWKVRAGLLLYDALALFRNVHRHEGMSAADVLGSEPLLAREGLVGGARYWDAATDDARLTLASALAAQELGAIVTNHTAVVSAVRTGSGGRLTGVMVRDQLTGDEFAVSARLVVNATGPWSDTTATLTGTALGGSVVGSAGTHIAVARDRIGNHDAVTLVSPVDGRVMFVLPAGQLAIIGTTERSASGGPDDVRATAADVSYLLNTVNVRFPDARLTRDDVVSAWAGIRPLAAVRAAEKSANSASREHAIAERADGLLSVTGGKLTTFRSMAADVMQHLLRQASAVGLSPTAVAARAAQQSSITARFPGGDMVSREATVADACAVVGDAEVGARLALAYGTRWRDVWRYAERDAALRHVLAANLPYVMAEVSYAVEHEMAVTLADVLIRRTHAAFELRDHGREAARRIAPLMAALLHWSPTEAERQLSLYDADVARIFGIDDI